MEIEQAKNILLSVIPSSMHDCKALQYVLSSAEAFDKATEVFKNQGIKAAESATGNKDDEHKDCSKKLHCDEDRQSICCQNWETAGCTAAAHARITQLEAENDKLRKYETAIIGQGYFGKLFLEYKGDPRGLVGRIGATGGCDTSKIALLEKEVFMFSAIRDIDGNKWIPVNEVALKEVIALCKSVLSHDKEAMELIDLAIIDITSLDSRPCELCKFKNATWIIPKPCKDCDSPERNTSNWQWQHNDRYEALKLKEV